MSDNSSSFWKFTAGGLAGAVIAYFGVLYAQKQASTAENHYFMELDQLRHAIILAETDNFEEKLELLIGLREAKESGFRPVFSRNLDSDIREVQDALARIAAAEQESVAAAVEARRQEEERAAAEAQERKEQAVRVNPLIYQDCGGNTGRYCP